MESKFIISPEPFIQKCKSLVRAKNLYLDVKDGQIHLDVETLPKGEFSKAVRANCDWLKDCKSGDNRKVNRKSELVWPNTKLVKPLSSKVVEENNPPPT